MIYDFMRVILFFDLPMITAYERKIYSRFRKELIKDGYMMLQYSVYCKITNNRESAINNVRKIKKVLPQNGQIRIMVVTEKQYAKMEIVVGGKSKQEETITVDSFISL